MSAAFEVSAFWIVLGFSKGGTLSDSRYIMELSLNVRFMYIMGLFDS